ncbi:hypothetical protein A9404_06915 [Halothiobacillus diazotrophicus]|uniref:Uncharacterized protein n=1 Tax=Halothiobacillus diazotrophicus TaxID=1860122 RepID=A0A191ZGZ1_9GAMM|nr:hypothetical protein A9404_06915 [Halothiobacillus diazotrophicus]
MFVQNILPLGVAKPDGVVHDDMLSDRFLGVHRAAPRCRAYALPDEIERGVSLTGACGRLVYRASATEQYGKTQKGEAGRGRIQSHERELLFVVRATGSFAGSIMYRKAIQLQM